MRILAPKDYASLPKLDAPAGYVCVLRDIDRDAYRIDSTDHPAAYVDRLLAELMGTYGIELLSILETDDIAESASGIFDAHHARLSDEWLNLDAYQLSALRKSELRILDFSSHYISGRQRSPADAARLSSSVARSPEGIADGQSRWERPDAPSPSVADQYRYGERRRIQQAAHEPDSRRQSLSNKFDDFWHNRPGLVIAFLLILMLVFLIHFWGTPYPY